MADKPPPERRHRVLAALGSCFGHLVTFVRHHPKLVLSVIALVVSLAWVGWAIWRREHTMHSPGPVALAHERFDCAACHTTPWQPIHRLVAEDQRKARLTMDQACIQCHEGLVHNKNEIASEVPICVNCHREHKGQHGLAKVADKSCTGCHANLRTVEGPSTKFTRSITALSTHPEFSVLRRGDPDRAVIRFNHAAHLKSEGLRGLDGKQLFLKCAACHQPTPDGRYMEPIRFDTHCATCHSNALVYDIDRFRNQPVPHGQPAELLRGLLRERYTQYIQDNPKELGKVTKVERPLPGRSGIQEVTKEEWTWVNQRLEQADRILFQHGGGCRYCHKVEEGPKGWQITPTKIPQRWLAHSKFSHFTHRLNPKSEPGQENCIACHSSTQSSDRTSDVLLPSIPKCWECHNQQRGEHIGRTDCIECHTYHNEIGPRRP